jgi:hypothetical protein
MGNCTACNSVINSNRRGKKYCSNELDDVQIQETIWFYLLEKMPS